LIALIVVTNIGACGDHEPNRPQNHSPVISSIVVFPTVLGPSDSALVICNATDADADDLVYDWVTDARLRIKNSAFTVYLFDSPDNSQIFYVGVRSAPVDTAWIQCTVRDSRGGADGRIVFLELHDDTISVAAP
jgi:hypothetical protein